ncbi:putative aminotransferase -like protein [Hapsidospora chrysogenum ATCC 11550]|uniref:Putative aminotransferase-like protein n=1 Tax=Hapsidospora chrysogenum (strain ATCC 11550 / CBS 779.69 / DSM 880 / IAM 14645 / JCM 23072 / IMI 49137) TaxID=857340 RepID=A0A086T4P9_HAPC1|nr:putative aminotransferase -like protein [Hapsidospora chrysogenum ATCC 11550]
MAPSEVIEAQGSTSTKPTQHQHRSGGRLAHRSFNHEPLMVNSAHGLQIHLANGQTILDACGGAAVATIGHNNDEVKAAVQTQMQQVSYVHTQAFTTRSAEDLADLLLEGGPGGLEMALFVCSGSEAMEAALKLARQYHYERGETERVHLVARRQGYHGNTVAAMSVSSNVARKLPYQMEGGGGLVYPHVSHVSPAYAYRYQREGESEDEFTARLLREIDDEFQRVGPGRVMAFVAEPVVGATAGCVPPPKGYLAGVRALCDKYGILLILDEVMCGAGRCGSFFAFEQEEGVTPDILTMAKGLGGGYAAIAGVLMHARVVDALKKGTGSFVHGHTYQAHPVSCAAALAVQRIIRRDGLVERCAAMGEVLERLLREELRACRSVGDVRGRGLFWAVEFVRDKDTKETLDPGVGFGVKVQVAALERGVAVYPGSGTVDGVRGDHVLLAPPYTVTEEQLGVVCRVLREAIECQEAKYLG